MLTEDTYTMNNRKPVIFIAHGLGGSMLLLFLQRQTQEWKDQYVRLFVSLAVAWGGSVNALKTFVEGRLQTKLKKKTKTVFLRN